jgi:hypothetical protein
MMQKKSKGRLAIRQFFYHTPRSLPEHFPFRISENGKYNWEAGAGWYKLVCGLWLMFPMRK